MLWQRPHKCQKAQQEVSRKKPGDHLYTVHNERGQKDTDADNLVRKHIKIFKTHKGYLVTWIVAKSWLA